MYKTAVTELYVVFSLLLMATPMKIIKSKTLTCTTEMFAICITETKL